MKFLSSLDDVHHHDLKLKSAYVHVVADAATSVLAIALAVCRRWPNGMAQFVSPKSHRQV